MNNINEKLESLLNAKENILMDKCMNSQFIISENDVLAKHYSLIDAEIESCGDFIVSTQWTIRGEGRGRFDLVVVKKWTEKYAHTKDCFKKNFPYYAVEYKIDDEPTYGKGHQLQDFVKDVRRLSSHCDYLHRAFALYFYRGNLSFRGNAFDKDSVKYLFRNENNFRHIDKLNAFFVDRFGVHRLDLN